MAANKNSKPKSTKEVEISSGETEVQETVIEQNEAEKEETSVENPSGETTVIVEKEDDETNTVDNESINEEETVEPVKEVVDEYKPQKIGRNYVHVWNGMEY